MFNIQKGLNRLLKLNDDWCSKPSALSVSPVRIILNARTIPLVLNEVIMFDCMLSFPKIISDTVMIIIN